jgi:multicomponent Na+:H+ antiporter subunit E
MTDYRHALPATKSQPPIGIVLIRSALLFGLWIVLMQSAKVGDVAVGALATVAATWASLRLLPPDTGRVRFTRLLVFVPRFLWQSLKAGIDVAHRAFAPSLPLQTGFVEYRTSFPRGQARNHFATITSMMPGTVPAGDGPDTIEFHCLDTRQPVVAQMAEEERLLAQALVPGETHG